MDKKRTKIFAVAEKIEPDLESSGWKVIVRIDDYDLKVADPWDDIRDSEEKAKEIAKDIQKKILKHTKEMIAYDREWERERHEYDPNYRG